MRHVLYKALKSSLFSLILLAFSGCSHSTFQSASSPSGLDDLSFYKGYCLWKDQLATTGTPYNLDEIARGMHWAKEGNPLPFSEEEWQFLSMKFEEESLARQRSENLREAELFLQQISDESDTIELIPSKLFYKQTKKGNGAPLNPKNLSSFIYKAKTLRKGVLEIVFSPGDLPVPISLPDTIPGFAKGVTGMLEGEARILFIHPELAYGDYGGKMDPNKLIVIEVERPAAE